jgi:hypothetical protein
VPLRDYARAHNVGPKDAVRVPTPVAQVGGHMDDSLVAYNGMGQKVRISHVPHDEFRYMWANRVPPASGTRQRG